MSAPPISTSVPCSRGVRASGAVLTSQPRRAQRNPKFAAMASFRSFEILRDCSLFFLEASKAHDFSQVSARGGTLGLRRRRAPNLIRLGVCRPCGLLNL